MHTCHSRSRRQDQDDEHRWQTRGPRSRGLDRQGHIDSRGQIGPAKVARRWSLSVPNDWLPAFAAALQSATIVCLYTPMSIHPRTVPSRQPRCGLRPQHHQDLPSSFSCSPGIFPFVSSLIRTSSWLPRRRRPRRVTAAALCKSVWFIRIHAPVTSHEQDHELSRSVAKIRLGLFPAVAALDPEAPISYAEKQYRPRIEDFNYLQILKALSVTAHM